MDAVLADRVQFAFTIMFHYLFPIGTMGLAPFVACIYVEGGAHGGDEEAARAAAFWTKIFAINFAIGVVTGIPMEFQFGTNWARFSRTRRSGRRPDAGDGRRVRVLPGVDLPRRAALRRGAASAAAARRWRR